MKHFYCYILALVACMFALPSSAKLINEVDHFYCDFSTEEEYNQWTVIDLNGKKNGNNYYWWDAEDHSAFFAPGSSSAGKDWLISPGIQLAGGKTYSIKFNFYSDLASNLKFTLGTAPTAAAQTIVLAENPADGYHGEFHTTVKFNTPADLAPGTYYVGIYNTTAAWKGTLYFRALEVIEDNDADLSVRIVDKATGSAISGNFTLTGDCYRRNFCDDWKNFTFNNLSPGNYTLEVTSGDYTPVTLDVAMEAKKNQSITVEMEHRVEVAVSGRVTDETGTPLAGASVMLEGAHQYTATTDATGHYTMSDVLGNANYQLTVSRYFKKSHTANVAVGGTDTTLSDVQLSTLTATPSHLSTTEVEPGMHLSWSLPVEEKTFIHDKGTYRGAYIYNVLMGSYYAMVGNRFRSPMTVDEVSWMTTDDGDQRGTVDVFVVALAKDGRTPAGVIYEKRGVKNTNYHAGDDPEYVWSTHKLSAPVTAPYGCIVAIGFQSSISIACDYAGDMGNSVLSSSEGETWSDQPVGNFFIRAHGAMLGGSGTAMGEAADVTFDVFRLKTADKGQPDRWTTIATGTHDFNCLDTKFSSLSQGEYQYAVRANYATGEASDYGFSAPIEHHMTIDLKVNVLTNSAIDMADGATVTLASINGVETYTQTVVDGTTTFHVRKGNYSLRASKTGFKTAGYDFLSLDPDSYELDLVLELAGMAPYALKATQDYKDYGAEVTWNAEDIIADDFESMDDFAVNPAGELGWTYVDADGKPTYGVAQCQNTPFPNMCDAKAFIVMNPSAAKPDLRQYIQAHSGDRMLASFSPADGTMADDYIFSPELNFTQDFTLSFWAASGFYATYGKDEFMVGYTTGDAKPDAVTWITESPVSVGALWTLFSYTLPADARHAVIRCVSTNRLMMLLDDITIGSQEPECFAMTTFDVYLDEMLVGSTTGRSMHLDGLSKGRHIVKVQAVYPMADGSHRYSDAAELTFRINEPEGIDEIAVDAPATPADALPVYDLSGRRINNAHGIVIENGRRVIRK